MRADGTPLDCSFSIGQQIVAYAPVGDHTMTPENVLLVRAWLFNPENSIPLMVGKLAAFYHDGANPGTDEEGRTMNALYKYNTGRYAAPGGQFAGNIGNYERGLAQADALLAAL